MNKGKKFLKILLAITVCLLLVGLVVMVLWNWLVPALFNGMEINFWQALGLLLLAKILFGGWGGGRWRGGHWGGPHAWKHRYYEKLSSMSPEERERFKEKIRQKWCAPREKESPPDTSNV